MGTYRHIVPNIYAELGIDEEPLLPAGVDFRSGAVIDEALITPIIYIVPYTDDAQLPHFESELVPVMSRRLVEALQGAGITNLQLFPAVLQNSKTGATWTDYFAVNVVGLIACASPSSKMEVLGLRSDGQTPLAVFNELIVAPQRAGGALMFRLAEAPGTILLVAPADGWNLTAYPVADE